MIRLIQLHAFCEIFDLDRLCVMSNDHNNDLRCRDPLFFRMFTILELRDKVNRRSWSMNLLCRYPGSRDTEEWTY